MRITQSGLDNRLDHELVELPVHTGYMTKTLYGIAANIYVQMGGKLHAQILCVTPILVIHGNRQNSVTQRIGIIVPQSLVDLIAIPLWNLHVFTARL
jgi:hypothetical protein